MKQIRFLIFLGILIPFFGQAQILDDSTKQIYGPSSTGFLFEKNFLEDDTILIHPDTLIEGFRLMTLNKENGWFWQDLGNEGTAAKNILFQTPDNAFTETGLNAFGPFYGPKTSDIKYYNTKSPFTNMAYRQSSNGLMNVGFTHSQNIMPNWNLALDMRRIASSKQYSASTSEDRLADHWNVTFSSNFTSKNRKYTFLGALVHFNHKQIDQGGIEPREGVEFVDKSDLAGNYNTNYQQLLEGIESREKWNNYHIYHQYQLSKEIQVFHTFDLQRQKYFHSDTLISTNSVYNIYPDSTSEEKMKNYYFFNNIQNRFGFKGFFKGFKYNVGLTNRIYAFTARSEGNKANNSTEILVGGNAGYWFPDSTSYLNTDFYFGFGNRENIYLNAKLKYKGFDLGFKFISKPAYLFNQNFISPVANWDNNFTNTIYTEASGKYRFDLGKFTFEPSARINLVSNHLYFDQELAPKQLSSEALLYDLNLFTGIKLKNFKFSNRFVLTHADNADVFRIPTVLNNTNLEFHLFYAKVLHLYIGTDVYFRSAYKADAYSPLLRGFYLQDSQPVWGLPVADVYTNFVVKRVKLAFSFNFLNQGLPYSGFYTTPNYVAMSRTFFIKVNWPLFD
ncbi:putative porin [Arcticibacterium luteifluviistationis]|uniref:Porin n=1 Tax=Arcticibacterium luteifluviistationis TaxID=1784714 RepID=A0A2Z4G6Y0_9BACT|nr:putative porin [Arcticibacterium luteifluviistationis]AWV96895.1 hypothetical protein DJ013_01345 [Arcticibacterium luteifluviistationis]